MQPNDPPLLVASTDQLGHARETHAVRAVLDVDDIEVLREALAVAWGDLLAAQLKSNDQAAEIERLRSALQRIARWYGEFPATGKFWDDEKTRPTSYSAEYGSSGERDYMRQVALDALGPNAKAHRLP